jgi:HK97 family phage portal protein
MPVFPEIRNLVKRFLPDTSGLISLDLKGVGVSGDVSGAQAQWYLDNGYYKIASKILSFGPGWSGEIVTIDTALGHSVVWACVNLIAGIVGRLPAIVMQETSSGKRVADEHPMYMAMRDMPNDEMTAQKFSETLTEHCLLNGNGYAQIMRRSGTKVAIGMNLLLPGQVEISREKTGQRRLIYIVSETGQSDRAFYVTPGEPQDILHLKGMGQDGIRGYSVLAMGRNSIGTAIAQERHLGRFFQMGGRRPYHLELGPMMKFENEEKAGEWREGWQKRYATPYETPITPDGIKYVEDGSSMRDAQLIESRQWTVSEICRWFGVFPPLVAELGGTNNSITENLTLNFHKMTLSRWLDEWESEFKRCILTPKERSQGFSLRHDTKQLLRTEFKTMMDAFSVGLQNGVFNSDYCRDQLDLDPIPNGAGESYRYQLNMQTMAGTGDPTVMEQGILARSAGQPKQPTAS